MATLPQNPTDLQAGVTFEQQPSLTWYVDPHTRRIRGTADGLQAVTQAVEIMLTTERFYWPGFWHAVAGSHRAGPWLCIQ